MTQQMLINVCLILASLVSCIWARAQMAINDELARQITALAAVLEKKP
jgi:hypothetical protein